MNPFNVFVNPARNAPGLVQNNRRGQNPWGTGDLIQAVLADVTNGKATLRMADDTTFTADAANLEGNVGDTLTFRVNRNEDGVSLTQVRERVRATQNARAERGNASLTDEFKEFTNTLKYIKENDELRTEHRQEQAAKVARAIASIRRAQNFMGSAGKSAVQAMLESGLDLTKVSFTDLSRVMHHANKKPASELPEAELDALVRNNRNVNRPENARNIIRSLHNHGLAVSDKNIDVMEQAYERVPDKVSPQAIEKLIASEQELTLDNVYKSTYASNEAGGAKPAPENQAAASLPQDVIESFFSREGIEATPENISTARFLLGRDLPLSLENIRNVQFLEALNPDEISRGMFFDRVAQHLSADIPVGAIPMVEVTRMAENQLKLAMQAAARHQGLNLDTDSMRDFVRNLQLTEESAISHLKMAGAEPEQANVTRMTSLFDALAQIRPLTSNVHAAIIQGTVDFNIKGVHESVKTAQANAMYEQNATIIRPEYGDGFAKVKDQFAPLLEGMSIKATDENIKAAQILSKNKMDVTGENLSAVKEIDAKITAIANKLHPTIAAHMIKDGLNPLELHADQVLSYIKQFNLDMGEDGADKIARYIMEMDESGAVDGDTRKSMIAMYRMLNVIRRDGAAALGLAMQMEGLKETLTLGDLLNLAQTYKDRKKGINVNVNDALGHLESLTRPTESIRGILEGSPAPTYSEVVTDSFIDIATPANLNRMMNSTDSMGQTIEDLAAQAPQEVAPEARIEKVQEQIQTFVSANPEVVHFLQSKGISATTGNIKAFGQLSSSRRALADELEGLDEALGEGSSETIDSLPTSELDQLKEGQSPGEILAQIMSVLTEGRQESSLSSLLAVTHGLNGDGEQGFQLPISINGRVSNLSLYVLNEQALTKDGARVLMSLDAGRLGTVTAQFTLSEGALDINISAPTMEALELLQAEQPTLESLLSQAGAEAGTISFFISQEPNNTSLPPDAQAETAGIANAIKPQSAYDFRV